MAFLTGERSSADVIALGPVRYVTWSLAELRGILEADSQLEAAVHGILGVDLARKLGQGRLAG